MTPVKRIPKTTPKEKNHAYNSQKANRPKCRMNQVKKPKKERQPKPDSRKLKKGLPEEDEDAGADDTQQQLDVVRSSGVWVWMGRGTTMIEKE